MILNAIELLCLFMEHALESLGKREIRELFSKGWLTHDAMWFAHYLESLGIEKNNALNRAAIRSMSAVEVLRLKHILGVETDIFDSFDELARFLKQAFEIVLADFMRAQFSLMEKNVLLWDLCLKQAKRIKAALGIEQVETIKTPWYYKPKKYTSLPGVKIDLLIDGRDQTINLC